MDSQNTQGIYVLGNDAIYDWLVAFMESFRQFNPDLRLILLPFDERLERVSALASRYKFEIHHDPAIAELERIGEAIRHGVPGRTAAPYARRWFRRFAVFWGPLQEFLYLDGRMLVLSDVREVLAVRRELGCDLLHYDCALDQVYFYGPFRNRLLIERRPHGFLSGMFASRRGLFDLAELAALAERAMPVLEHLNTPNTDQCFLNFICDSKPVSYANLSEVLPDVTATAWAWIPGVYRARDGYRRWDHDGLDHNRRVLMLHWAGLKMNAIMPYRRIFLRYRLRPEPLAVRAMWRLRWALQYPGLKLADLLRRNRWCNVAYHYVKHKLTGRPVPAALRSVMQSSSG